MAKVVKKKFKIDGMHCSACAMNIDFDLEDLEGITSAKTNYAKQESVVEYDEEKTQLDQVIKTIEKAGYRATTQN